MPKETAKMTDLFNRPIPELKPSTGWKQIPINECGEPLVLLNSINPNIVIDQQYFNQGIKGSSPKAYIREGLAKKLVLAARSLPSGHKLVIWDAWRDLAVQQSLFDEFKEKLRAEHPDITEEELSNKTQVYVSLPSIDERKPSPHNTGGSVDLSIVGPKGKPIPMGVPFDHFGPESATRYYEEKPTLTSQEILYRNNRRLLCHTMMDAGIIPYDEEIWHYDLNNQFEAVRSGKPFAIYGKASLPTK